jgi:hypothetical protein
MRLPGPKKCSCEKTFSDPDATCGVQRNKANQNKYFIGYRKLSPPTHRVGEEAVFSCPF